MQGLYVYNITILHSHLPQKQIEHKCVLLYKIPMLRLNARPVCMQHYNFVSWWDFRSPSGLFTLQPINFTFHAKLSFLSKDDMIRF